MNKHLVIAEVSQKQAYIFGKRELKANIQRSAEISHITNADESPEDRTYFSECFPDYTEENLVYAGGGHTVLQFSDFDSAQRFCRALTRKTLEEYPEIELFVKIMPVDVEKSIGDNLLALTRQLEAKKARRRASFQPLNFGIEKSVDTASASISSGYAPNGWRSTNNLTEIAGDENFIAVVHLDGNAMGARVQAIYDRFSADHFDESEWNACIALLQQFSSQIDLHFQRAYQEMTADLTAQLIEQDKTVSKKRWEKRILPVRRVIGAGDDICFVTSGDLGVECAVNFIKHLSQKINAADGKSYAACAGVVMVHTKYPFRVAYDLSEELCANAKRSGAVLCQKQGLPEGAVSLVDWHIEYGQLKGSLSQIRQAYQTEDGGRLELRPFIVSGTQQPVPRTYAFFRALLSELRGANKELPRSKVKQLREALKQGEWETKLALKQTQIRGLTQKGLEARYPDLISRMLNEKFKPEEAAFYTDESGMRRCLYFDAIEIIDHFTLWQKEDAQ